MISKQKVIKNIEAIKTIKATFGLADEELAILKAKFNQINNWKDIAVTQITDIKSRLTIIEHKLDLAQQKFVEVDARLTALENA